MKGVLTAVLSMSLSGSILILILLACVSLTKGRVSRQWQYYIWLAVIARLLLPFAPRESLMGAAAAYVHSLRDAGEISGTFVIQAGQARGGLPAAGSGTENGRLQEPAGVFTEPGVVLLAENLWVIWLAVGLGLFLRRVTAYRSFVRSVRADGSPCADPALLDRAAALGKRLGFQKPVELYCSPHAVSPMLTGFFHPCIILRTFALPAVEFDCTVLHELTHCRRLDLFYKWLVQLTVCVHWFNPLVRVMAREINRACEFSCDEAVVSKMDACARREYGRTLLEGMRAAGAHRGSEGSVSLSENKIILKERLGAIMGYQKRSGTAAAAAALLTALLVAGANAVGVYAAPRADAAGAGSRPVPAEEPVLTARQRSLLEEMEPYGEFGLEYDAGRDTVYYNDQPVKAFVDFMEDDSTAFRLGYFDEEQSGEALCLIAEHDEAWKVTGIGPMPEEIASMLFEAYGEAVEGQRYPREGYLTFDGTNSIGEEIYATDYFEEGGIPQETAEWIAGCEEEGAVYVNETVADGRTDGWICFNGGKRRGWMIAYEDGVVRVTLLDRAPEDLTGPTVIRYSLPAKAGTPEVYLEKEKLQVNFE